MQRCYFVALIVGSLVLVPCAGASSPPRFSNAQGSIITLTPSGLTVKGPGLIAMSCSRDSSSPDLSGFNVGDAVTMDCHQGVLTGISPGLGTSLGAGKSLPGLTGPAHVMPAPGPMPTKQECASAWNTTAPMVARDAVAALQPLAARVLVGSLSVAGGHPFRTVANGPICSITFVLPGTQTVKASGVWKNAAVPLWKGFLAPGFLLDQRSRFLGRKRRNDSTPLTDRATS